MDLSPFAWIAVATGAAVILTFIVQIALGKPEGFIARTSWTMLGIVVLAGVATLVVWLVGL